MTKPLIANPYVGPRTFSRNEKNQFFGRDREARDLRSLVVSERLVLFYAQSGAGKSSLINTRLIPQLVEDEGFVALPIGRVGGELPDGIDDVNNIFAFNLMLNLEKSGGDPGRFTHMSLPDFLAGLTTSDGEHYVYDETVSLTGASDHNDDEFVEPPHVLIIDQFEEIVTSHLERWPERTEFFRQLNQAMADDPLLWVVLTLREDNVAALRPYARMLPGQMRARFYMQRMKSGAALLAIKEPAQLGNRPFADGVAEALLNNLRQIRATDEEAIHFGEFVEPVQLQVVCYQLWQNLKGRDAAPITEQDLAELGDVDKALAQFYEQALTHTLQKTNVSELELRNWFGRKLITEAETRGTVYQGQTSTAGLDNRVVQSLADQFLLRTETRAGGHWVELVHDRFIGPILQANQAWNTRQSPLTQAALAWHR
ncbi:MAG: ATP-binding protein, partial [Chloroflexi bacterium]